MNTYRVIFLVKNEYTCYINLRKVTDYYRGYIGLQGQLPSTSVLLF